MAAVVMKQPGVRDVLMHWSALQDRTLPITCQALSYERMKSTARLFSEM